MGGRQAHALDLEPDDRLERAATSPRRSASRRRRSALISPFIGGGFGGKLFLRADALLAALGARAAGRPVKVALHAAADVQQHHAPAGDDPAHPHRRDAATARSPRSRHESWSGDLPGGKPETAVDQTRLLYAGANRMTATRLAVLDLPEGNAMRAPGEAPGMMALEIAMDEMAEKLGHRSGRVPHPQRHPGRSRRSRSGRSRSASSSSACALGAERFGWSKRNPQPGQVRDGRWLVGMGVAAAFRNNLLTKSAARVRLDSRGIVTVETDMTDIGTGSYTIIAQTAAEMMGVPLDKVVVRLGDSTFPVSAGSGGQWGANNSTAGVYAACVKLREAVAQKLGFNSADAVFADGQVRVGQPQRAARPRPRATAASSPRTRSSTATSTRSYQQSTFGAHFVEVGVDAATGEIRVRRMLAVCAAGRILNPKIGAQPGDRRDDHGRRRGADGGARGRQARSASSSTTTSPATRCRSMPTSRTRR